jgi:hypothetical protein
MRQRFPILITLALLAAACETSPSELDPTLGPLAELYLIDALDVMEFNSVRRYEIDWPAFRATARAEAEAAGARTPVETYPTVIAALERIGDRHSFFVPAQVAPQAEPAGVTGPASIDPSTQVVAPGIGYLDVPAFQGGGQAGDDLADQYHALIQSVDTLAPMCRWVVDLRGNTGGNMWPMIAGVGPILGEGTVGYFIDPDTVTNTWFYDNGRAGIDDLVIARAETPYVLGSPLPNVAVLTDSLTASSGEAVAVAFRGRPGARSFGEATWGVSTANVAFQLSDGSVIFLTTTTSVDRLGTRYGQELQPDEVVPAGTKTGDPASDTVLSAALTWLNAQACS